MNNTSHETAWESLPSGLVVSDMVADRYYEALRRPVAIDLFAGAGGFSLGVTQAGFDVVAAVDSDPVCALTYMHNLGSYPCQFHFIETSDEERMEKVLQDEMKRNGQSGFEIPTVSGGGWISHEPAGTQGTEHFFLGDIRQMTGRDILEPLGLEIGQVDLIIGGPPCQGFTTAGKRNVADPRNTLVFEFVRMVCEIQPKAVCMENVPGMMNMVTPDGLPIIDALCRILEDGDFGTYKALLKTIESQSGVMFLKSKPRAVKEQQRKTKKESPQMRMFDETESFPSKPPSPTGD